MGLSPTIALLDIGNIRNAVAMADVLDFAVGLRLGLARTYTRTLLDRPDESAVDLVGHDSGILLVIRG